MAATSGISDVKKYMDTGTSFFVVDDTQRPAALVPTSKPTLADFAADWKRSDLTGADAAAWEASKAQILAGIKDGTLTY